MAITWIGGTSGDPAVAGNYAGGVAPVSNDVLVFPATGAQRPMSTNMAALTAVDLDAIIWQKGYPFGTGNAGAPFDVSADRVECYGGLDHWLKDGAGTIDEVFLSPLDLAMSTHLHLFGDTVTVASAYGGQLTIEATIGNVALLNVGGAGRNPLVTILSNANTLTDLVLADGNLTSEMIVTRAYAAGGTWRTLGSKAHATIVNAGASIIYDSTGTITTLNQLRGSTDLGDRAKTVTGGRILGGTFRYISSLHTVTGVIDYRNAA